VPIRLLSLGAAIALIAGLVGALGATGAIVASCYDLPQPDCGFVCGPSGACPDGYSCASDQRCHRLGAPAGLICPSPDAAIDAAPDAAADAGVDTAADAAADAALDAAEPDAAAATGRPGL
jgi:hypothetical protein